jgi:DNA-binding NarL/FixJ family response regulator
MVIVDRTVAMLPIHPVRHLVGAQVLSDPQTVAQLVAVFLELADQGTPVRPQREASTFERETLRLMAAGEKDEAIARRLAVSVRTVRRSIAGLLAASGAESRFQLALHALQVGWLSPEEVTSPALQ